MQLEKILSDAEKSKGEFLQRSSTSQQIKSTFRWQPNWENLSDYKKEALEMMADRISGILNGNSDNTKSWCSIEGYAKLVADSIQEQIAPSREMIIESV